MSGTVCSTMVVGTGCWSFTGRYEFTHKCAYFPCISVEQGVEVLLLLTRHTERRIRIMSNTELRYSDGGISNNVSDTVLNILDGHVWVESGHENLMPPNSYNS